MLTATSSGPNWSPPKPPKPTRPNIQAAARDNAATRPHRRLATPSAPLRGPLVTFESPGWV
ncbi:hypothetical protein PJP10_25735 [Mycobacterium kansasii]